MAHSHLAPQFQIINRPDQVSLEDVFPSETHSMRPYVQQASQLLEIGNLIGLYVAPDTVRCEATLAGHQIDMLVDVKPFQSGEGAGEGPRLIAIELQRGRADVRHFRQMLHGALCHSDIVGSVWIASHFDAEIKDMLASAQSKLKVPLYALEMIPRPVSASEVWIEYVRVTIPQGSQQEAGDANQALKHRSLRRSNRAGAAKHDNLATNAAKPFAKAHQALWGLVARKLIEIGVTATEAGVGANCEPLCVIGLGHKGARLHVQLHKRSRQLALSVHLQASLGEALQPKLAEIGKQVQENLEFKRMGRSGKSYKITLPPTPTFANVSASDQNSSVISFVSRVDTVRKAFRAVIESLPPQIGADLRDQESDLVPAQV